MDTCVCVQVHLAWIRTPRKKGGLGLMQIPLLADVDRRISTLYGVLNADYVPNRGIFLIDPKVRVITNGGPLTLWPW
jgi:peroxiredoxin (alkyl hydroperoxide reductase subunit C)